MTVDLARIGPLHHWNGLFAELPDGVVIMAEPFVAQATVRSSDPGAGVPVVPGTWTEDDGRTAIWLGPDEWLVTSPFVSPETLAGELRRLVAPRGGTVVDTSAQRTTLRLRGEHAHDVLAGGCALDLHPRVFRRGSAAQTVIGRAGVVLLALDDTATDYRLLVRSSFARHLASWLLDAAVEHSGPGA